MRDIRFRPVHVLIAVLAAACIIGLLDNRSGGDAKRLFERLFPTPSAYSDVLPPELERRMAALYGPAAEQSDQLQQTSLRIDGCQIVLTTGGDRRACDPYPGSPWYSEQRYDLRLLETAPHAVKNDTKSHRGISADFLRIPVSDEAAARIVAAGRQWSELSIRLTRSARADGSDLAGRMEKFREFARTGLDDRLWERFAHTARYCEWGDVTGPPITAGRDAQFMIAPGRGHEFAELLHAYKVARCPSDATLLDTE